MQKPLNIFYLICLALTAQVRAATINVPADYTSLQAALVAAASGDEIVISTNGPFNEFIALYGSMATNVTIRAAAGFNPVIEGKTGMTFTGGTPPDAPIQDGVLCYIEQASSWVGIKFRIDMAGLDEFFGNAGEKYQCLKVGTARGGNINFTNCVFEWANDPVDPDVINSRMLRLEGGSPGGNNINFDHCQWRYTSMSPVDLSGRVTGAFSDTIGLALDANFTDCTFDISPDTSGRRRHAVGAINTGQYTFRFRRCDFGEVMSTDPSTNANPRQGQSWVNAAHKFLYFDDCRFGPGAGRTIATAIPGEVYVNRCLFRPTRGNFTLNDPASGGITIPTYFTNCVFQFRTTATGATPINNFAGSSATGTGEAGRGSFIFSHCTYVDLDGAAGRTNRGFISVGDTVEGAITIENSLFSAPAMAGCGIIKNLSLTPAGTEASPNPGGNIAGTITVNGTNMLFASSSYKLANDAIQHAGPNKAPILANPLLQADSIHLSAGSPAIDAAGNLGVLVDYDGNVRPMGPRPDIGADEMSIAAALAITRSGANVVISWTGGGTLQSAPQVTGPYANIVGATSPHTIPITSTAQFYRTAQ